MVVFNPLPPPPRRFYASVFAVGYGDLFFVRLRILSPWYGLSSRLYVLLAWLQAVVQERLRYVPLGWSKR